MQTNIVSVQFKRRNWHGQGDEFGGACYSYITDVPLCVGDVVKVPTKYGDNDARVVRVDVPDAEVAAIYDQLRHITEPATPGGGLFDGFY